MIPRLVGVLNITPDSFSDGGNSFETKRAIQQAISLISDGAEIIDIGGDSTRPGSKCVGAAEEWKRIEEAVREISSICEVSVDTHFAETAEKSIENGARIINDISAGGDPKMFNIIANSNAKIIITYTRCSYPHDFSNKAEGDIILRVRDFFETKLEQAFKVGIKQEQIILDPGMGAFISDDAERSWELLRRFSELSELESPFMLGISRKGFLKLPEEGLVIERDHLSAFVAFLILERSPVQYLRVHNVKLHTTYFDVLRRIVNPDSSSN